MQSGKIKFYVLQLKITCGELHTNKCNVLSISDKVEMKSESKCQENVLVQLLIKGAKVYTIQADISTKEL